MVANRSHMGGRAGGDLEAQPISVAPGSETRPQMLARGRFGARGVEKVRAGLPLYRGRLPRGIHIAFAALLQGDGIEFALVRSSRVRRKPNGLTLHDPLNT